MDNEVEQDATVVLAHAIADQAYRDEEGFWNQPLLCELEDGEMAELSIVFGSEDSIKEVEKYFMSPEGMEPLEFVF